MVVRHRDRVAAGGVRRRLGLGVEPARRKRLRRAPRSCRCDDDEEDARDDAAGWSWYVIVLVALNIVGCALAAVVDRASAGPATRSRKTPATSGTATSPNTTSRCRAGGSTCSTSPSSSASATCCGIPGMGAFAGYGKWTSAGEHDAATRQADDAQLEETFAPYRGQSDRRARAPIPMRVALGRSIFNNTCATCHGSSAQGAVGYPNLTDDIWHWGGSPERVLQTVLDGREGVMPEWGKVLTGMGGEHAVDDVAAYVRALLDPARACRTTTCAAQGKQLYDGVCVGLPRRRRQGQPGDRRAGPDRRLLAVRRRAARRCRRRSPTAARAAMPAHRALLGETRARLVAAYVWSLSHPAAAGRRQDAQR